VRLQQSSNLTSFLEEFTSLIENLISFQKAPTSSIADISSVIKQISSIGWENLIYADEEFTTTKFSYKDDKNRTHVLTVKMNSESQATKLVCLADLPVPFQPKYTQGIGSLNLIYEQFKQAVHTFQLLWDILEEIDQHCCILEPENITYGCTYRRIALGKNASVYIQVNSATPFEFPECRMLGADNVLDPIKRNLNGNLDNWNNNDSLLENLQSVLGITFPSPATHSKEDITMTCGICYSYRLNDEIPECTCDDPRCGQTYHNSCLAEWLRSLSTCRQSFNIIFGECPYCNKSLTVRLSKTI